MNLRYLVKNSRFGVRAGVPTAPYYDNKIFSVTIGYFSAVGLHLGVDLLFLLISVMLSTAVIYQINNVYDVGIDRNSKKEKNYIVKGKVTRREVAGTCLVMSLLSLLLALLVNFNAFLISAGILVMGSLYSMPPVRIKNIPGLDVLFHGTFWGAFIVMLGASAGNFSILTYVLIFLGFLLSCGGDLGNQVRDYIEDNQEGLKTTVVLLGRRTGLILYRLIYVVAFFAALYLIFVYEVHIYYVLMSAFYILFYLFNNKDIMLTKVRTR